jgi:DNA topoisomerase IA
MKNSKISPKSFQKDVNKVLELINKINDIDFEKVEEKDLDKISQEIKKTDKFIKNKYKDLDIKE